MRTILKATRLLRPFNRTKHTRTAFCSPIGTQSLHAVRSFSVSSNETSIKRLRSEARFSEIVIHNRTVYLSGQLADDLNGDVRAQTRETLTSIDQFLHEAGTDKSKVLSVTIYLKNMSDYNLMNEEWDAWVPVNAAPARTTVESKLYDENVLVEMTVIAAQ